jgi:hypothetical protein
VLHKYKGVAGWYCLCLLCIALNLLRELRKRHAMKCGRDRQQQEHKQGLQGKRVSGGPINRALCAQ